MAARPLQFIELEGGCFVPITHRLNHDGYFRKRWKKKSMGNVVEMFHRFIWRAHHGDIPEGQEVDHVCGNRACCNPQHLRLLEGLDHTVHTNRTRYADRKDAAKDFWINNPCTGTRLGELFGVSFSAACQWIREWRER